VIFDERGFFILDDRGEPCPASYLTHRFWMAGLHPKRVVGITDILGKYEVTTVFFGKPTRMWERRIRPLNSTLLGRIETCTGSREQAEALHVEGVTEVCGELGIELVSVHLL